MGFSRELLATSRGGTLAVPGQGLLSSLSDKLHCGIPLQLSLEKGQIIPAARTVRRGGRAGLSARETCWLTHQYELWCVRLSRWLFRRFNFLGGNGWTC